MNRPGIWLILVSVICLLVLPGCGGEVSIQEELRYVPGLSFLHVHIGPDMDLGLVPDRAGTLFPLWLADSLLARGGFGVSLMGVNLTDLSPQLMFLSRRLSAEEMAEVGKSGFQCSARETDEGFDLIDDRGSVMGSVSSRDGWTCLITGSGADRSASRWLNMEESESLAADSDLVAISDSETDFTILASSNSIGFLSVIPTGMLTRQQIGYLNFARNFIADLGLRAAGLCIDVTNDRPGLLTAELRMVREGGHVTSISVGFSDTGIPPDSAASYLFEFYGLDGGDR